MYFLYHTFKNSKIQQVLPSNILSKTPQPIFASTNPASRKLYNEPYVHLVLLIKVRFIKLLL